MSLTQEQVTQIRTAAGYSPTPPDTNSQGQSLADRLGFSDTAAPAPEPTLGQKISQRFSGIKDTAVEGVDALQNKEDINPVLSGVEAASKFAQLPLRAAGAVGGTVGDTVGAGIDAITPTPRPELETADTSKLKETYQGTPEDARAYGEGNILQGAVNAWKALSEKHPDIAQTFGDIGNLFNVTGAGEAGAALKPLGKSLLKENALRTAEEAASTATKAALKAEQTAIDAVTPNPEHMTPTEHDAALAARKISPKTTTSPSSYIMSPEEKATAVKYKDLLQTKDPVENSVNVMSKIDSTDKEVGKFLEANNTSIDPTKMKDYLTDKMKDISDITVDPERIDKSKQMLINNFVDSLKEKNVFNAWQDRKAFDAKIDTAFKGSPTLAKEVKRGLRDGVQSYIADNTPEGVYKGKMADMTQLYKLQDVLATQANKEKGLNGIKTWVKANPTKAKLIGAGATVAGGDLLWNLMH